MAYYHGENEEREAPEQEKNAQDHQDGAVTVDSGRGLIHCMTVIGQIEGHTTLPNQTKATKYEHMIPQLAAIEESPEIRGLLLLLNTIGGDVEAGLAIAELLASMKTPTASLVLGGGHSIGVPLAVAAQRSFIVPSATMTIHPCVSRGSSSARRRRLKTSCAFRSGSSALSRRTPAFRTSACAGSCLTPAS